MSENDRIESAEPRGSVFSTTHWSVVLTAGQFPTPQSAEALEKLCRTYWQPLYVYVRRRGYNPEDSQDLTQKFFENFLKKYDLIETNFKEEDLYSLLKIQTNKTDIKLTEKSQNEIATLYFDSAKYLTKGSR